MLPPPFQPSLFNREAAAFDRSFARLTRLALDARSWIDHAPGWLAGSDGLFEELLGSRGWGQRTRRMYERRLPEPRLTSHWTSASGEPLRPELLEELRRCLGARYGVTFDSVGFNLYRDGRDSVAWHGDRIRKEIAEPVVALVSLGEPRKFLVRPHGGGRSIAFTLGRGDLLVTGGRAQRDWEHSVPKVSRAGPRISLAFRHGLDPRAYGRDAEPDPEPEP
jgi:alkylated DNA repair dioxygenase AlkB